MIQSVLVHQLSPLTKQRNKKKKNKKDKDRWPFHRAIIQHPHPRLLFLHVLPRSKDHPMILLLIELRHGTFGPGHLHFPLGTRGLMPRLKCLPAARARTVAAACQVMELIVDGSLGGGAWFTTASRHTPRRKMVCTLHTRLCERRTSARVTEALQDIRGRGGRDPVTGGVACCYLNCIVEYPRLSMMFLGQREIGFILSIENERGGCDWFGNKKL